MMDLMELKEKALAIRATKLSGDVNAHNKAYEDFMLKFGNKIIDKVVQKEFLPNNMQQLRIKREEIVLDTAVMFYKRLLKTDFELISPEHVRNKLYKMARHSAIDNKKSLYGINFKQDKQDKVTKIKLKDGTELTKEQYKYREAIRNKYNSLDGIVDSKNQPEPSVLDVNIRSFEEHDMLINLMNYIFTAYTHRLNETDKKVFYQILFGITNPTKDGIAKEIGVGQNSIKYSFGKFKDIFTNDHYIQENFEFIGLAVERQCR